MTDQENVIESVNNEAPEASAEPIVAPKEDTAKPKETVPVIKIGEFLFPLRVIEPTMEKVTIGHMLNEVRDRWNLLVYIVTLPEDKRNEAFKDMGLILTDATGNQAYPPKQLTPAK